MKDYGTPIMQKKFGLLYDIYGIYIDWKIDNNIFIEHGIADPHGINTFKDFCTKDLWQVATVTIANQDYLIADLNLPHFNYASMTTLNKTILEENIPPWEIIGRILHYHKKTNLPPLNQMKYYIHLVYQQENKIEFVHFPQ